MFYIRPPSRPTTPAAVKPIGTQESVSEDDLAVTKVADAPPAFVPTVERRKRQDRRKASRDSLLETRSNDRRKASSPSINIKV
ncbi:MAG TPA: hypothetical protein VN030_12805 [Cellvibrio sp.]|nr:hypothetical protein [Cellvibrio sp.]